MIDSTDKTPIAFVNVDGVLTNAGTYWAKGPKTGPKEGRVINPVALRLLAQFQIRTKARIVMASQWSGFLFKSPEAWSQFFEQLGQPLPVTDMLPCPEGGKTWTDEMVAYMAARPGVPFVMFEDDPGAQKHPQVVEVDARVGLNTVNLQQAAELLEPGSALALELAQLNKSFSGDVTISISAGGRTLEVHPRDLGKGLEELGVGKPAAAH